MQKAKTHTLSNSKILEILNSGEETYSAEQAREISNISPLGKLTAALDMGMDSKYYIRYLDTKMKMMEYTRFLKIGNKKKSFRGYTIQN